MILGIIYLDQDDQTQSGVSNINGALFILITNLNFGNVFAVVNVRTIPVFTSCIPRLN